MKSTTKSLPLFALLTLAGTAQAFTFQTDNWSGSFDSNITAGFGKRTQNPGCEFVVPGTNNGLSGCATGAEGALDQGDINYKKGDYFTTYLKGTHELLLKQPEEQLTFMARVSWLRDFSATKTSGLISNQGAGTLPSQTPEAADDLKFKGRVLDLWASKGFDLGGESAKIKFGNQVISWGESIFLPGGINQVNSMDLMRLSQPGTQLKEVFLPAPIASFTTTLGSNLNLEAYYQFRWNGHYFPPIGSYWSTALPIGKGAATWLNQSFGVDLHDNKPTNSGQYGAALKWQPQDINAIFGLYGMSYTDKGPSPTYSMTGPQVDLNYLTDRRMYGVSVNFPVGNWAIGSELSYRPKDAVLLNPNIADSTGVPCGLNGGQCWYDNKKLQWYLTGILSLTPGDYGAILDVLHAQTATLLAEAVVINYPGLKKFYNGVPISAGGWSAGSNNQNLAPFGSQTSWGYNFDFSWTYDNTLIQGWQVIPEVYYFQAVKGNTPNTVGLFLEGAKSANFALTFAQNPTKWQVGLNYSVFWGGDTALSQPLRDRDFLGGYVTLNF